MPAADAGGLERRGAQHFEQYFAAPGGIGGQQYPARVLLQEAGERRQRLFGAQIDAPLVWCRRRKVVAAIFIGKQGPFDFEAVVIDARESRQPRFELVGREVQLLRRQHRPLDVVAAFLVSFGDYA